MDKRDQIIWAAGYFEARSGVYLGTSQNQNQVRIMVTDRDFERLNRFAGIVGAGKITGVKTGSAKAGASSQWLVSSRDDIKSVVRLLLPYTGGTCREKILDAQAYMHSHPLMSGD